MLLRRGAHLFIGLLLAASSCVAQAPATPPKELQDVDAIVAKAMAEWQIPGLSVAVVKDGKVIYAKGFGYRDVERKLPVTTDTLFAIGSISKSFTSLVFATMNDEGKVEWDKPARSYLPTFQMDDPIATDHATPRDLLSHRSGLPGHDLVWYSSDFSREDLMHRMKYLKSNKELRYGYEYCNLMIMAMGYLEGQVMNTSWEDLVQKRVFTPLGMNRSNFSVSVSEKDSDAAQPYELKKDVVTKVPFKFIDPIGPAGSINSSINDMSKYMTLHLGDGTYNGAKIVSPANLKLVHTGQTPITQLPEFFTQNGLGPMTYAMGWVDTTFRGHHMVWHNGGIDGFHSLLTMLPEDKIGVVLLSNLGDSQALEPIAYTIFDRLVGIPHDPWMERYAALHQKAKKAEAEAEKAVAPSTAKTGTQLSHPIGEYVGEYLNPGYGTVKIAQKGSDLEISVNKMGPYPFARLHYDIFQVPEKSDSVTAGVKGQFLTNWNGDIDRLSMPLQPTLPEDIVFVRAAEELSATTLQSLVGDYVLGDKTAHVGLAGETLQIAIPGQSPYELLPSRGLTFNLKGLNGYSLEFKKDAAGNVSEIVFMQPDGSVVAKRK